DLHQQLLALGEPAPEIVVGAGAEHQPLPGPAGQIDEADIMAEFLSGSSIHLGEEAVLPEEQAPPAVNTSDSAIDLSADAILEEPIMAAPPRSDSAIDLGMDAIIEESIPIGGKEESAIDLSADAIVEESLPADDGVVELPADVVVEEGIDVPSATL